MIVEKEKLRGQAILELAIFGAILILLLGVLISYGLRYGYQQQAMQYSFRKALSTADNAFTSHVVVRDRHILDPSDPFSAGSVIPFASSASTIRSVNLDQTPDKAVKPLQRIDVRGTPEEKVEVDKTTAFFREVVPGETWQIRRRYEEVYGVGNAWRVIIDDDCLREKDEPVAWETGKPPMKVKEVTKNEIPFNRFMQRLNYLLPVHSCAGEPDVPPMLVKVYDSCDSEILNYDSAVRQCLLSLPGDPSGTCYDSCKRGGSTDCDEVCGQDIEEPWYCERWSKVDGKYVFPNLLALFDRTRFRDMGLQKDYVQATTMENKLEKTEDESNITTTDTFNQKVTAERKIYYKAGETMAEVPVNTTVEQDKETTWSTPWE